jgi:hypothetical protein
VARAEKAFGKGNIRPLSALLLPHATNVNSKVNLPAQLRIERSTVMRGLPVKLRLGGKGALIGAGLTALPLLGNAMRSKGTGEK